MKKMLAKLLLFVCLCTMCGFTGCGRPEDPPAGKTAVCFVVGGTGNSQGLNMNSPLVQDTVYSTVRNYGFVGVVSADGEPEAVHAASYEIEEKYKKASPERLNADARSKATALIAGMESIVANDPEVDYLESLRLAVRMLASLEGYETREIIVIGTGLSTVGIMDFHNNLLSADPDTVVAYLSEHAAIPDFTGLTVYWQQLGDVAAPQSELTPAQRQKLEAIYRGLVEAGGGEFVCNQMIPNPVNTSVTYPAVTPVELPPDTPFRFEPEQLPAEDDADLFADGPWMLTEGQVGFKGDSAEYRNPEEALEVIKPFAECLCSRPDVRILLAGTTAGDTYSEADMVLSRQRAETVRASLISLGVDPGQILAIGLGSTLDPWHIYGAGTGDSAAASSNRKVILMNADSDTARELLALVSP